MRFLTAIPVFNEARHVERVLGEVRRYSPHIVVINDGSTDATAELLARQSNLAVVTHPTNRGYGAAIQSAFRYALQAGADVLVTMDCDGQHEPSRIPLLLESIDDADIVSGSRYLRDFRQDTQAPQDRQRINQVVTSELNARLGLDLTDAFCGFKAYRRQALEHLAITEPGWGMPLQLWVQAARAGLRIKEVGVPRLYLDPNRAFGGVLNDEAERLAYYRRIINAAEASSPPRAPPPGAARPGVRVERDPLRKGLPLLNAPLRAPAGDGEILAVPPLDRVGDLLAGNELLLARSAVPGLDRAAARSEVLAAARDYLRQGGEPVPDFAPARVVMAGHQPELFHPGVWVKNFALAGLARRLGATALNLVVDSDTLKAPSLKLPPPDGTAPEVVPFDSPGEGQVYEERRVADPELFASFGDRVGRQMESWGFRPLIRDLWPAIRARAAENGGLIGDAFAAGRRGLERAWGCHTLEVPASVVCGTDAFAGFVHWLLSDLPRFHAVHNSAVHAYRKRNHLRSLSHPVPDLERRGDWLEAPLWGWRAGQARRARLFVRATGHGTELRAGGDAWPTLPPLGDRDEFRAAWRALGGQGCRARGRALVTTLFARLVLADLFVHGIGGGKYDEVTDDILRQLTGIDPPGILVLSATLRLPLGRAALASGAEVGAPEALQRQLRDLHWNPQRHLPGGEVGEEVGRWLREKAEWVARAPETHEGRRDRFRRLQEVTAHLRAALPPGVEDRLRAQVRIAQRRQAGVAVRASREYSLALFPEGRLRDFCSGFLAS